MSALSRFEELVETLVERSLIGGLGAQVQPVEMAKRLARAMEAERAVGVGRAIAPNDYVVCLHPEDFARFAPVKESLERELADYVREAARERRFSLLSRPAVRLDSSADVARRQIRVSARLADAPALAGPAAVPVEHTQRFLAVPATSAVEVPQAAEEVVRTTFQLVARDDGGRYPIARTVVTLGRALDNDIVLEDSRVSRYHAELRLEGQSCRVRDLRSTNGTLVNGRVIAESALATGDLISIGGLELRLESEKLPGRGRGA